MLARPLPCTPRSLWEAPPAPPRGLPSLVREYASAIRARHSRQHHLRRVGSDRQQVCVEILRRDQAIDQADALVKRPANTATMPPWTCPSKRLGFIIRPTS